MTQPGPTADQMDQMRTIPGEVTTKLSVFPNPAKNNFSIQFGVIAKSQWKFALYNTLGHTISLPKANLEKSLKTVNFDLSKYNLAPGIYQLIMTNKLNEKKITQVIIQ